MLIASTREILRNFLLIPEISPSAHRKGRTLIAENRRVDGAAAHLRPFELRKTPMDTGTEVGAAPANVLISVKVLIADDHLMVGQGIESLLRSHFYATALVTSGEALLEAVRTAPPDIVVADISMAGISGFHAMQTLREEGHVMPFLLLTMHDEPALVAKAIRTGARGYVLKSSAGDELISALTCIMRGGTYVTPSLTVEAIRNSTAPRYTLTAKQSRILELVRNGLRSKQIADELGLSVRTIESHKYLIMQKLNVHGTLALIRRVEQEELLRPDADE